MNSIAVAQLLNPAIAACVDMEAPWWYRGRPFEFVVCADPKTEDVMLFMSGDDVTLVYAHEMRSNEWQDRVVARARDWIRGKMPKPFKAYTAKFRIKHPRRRGQEWQRV